jgi:5S rRNA maturation endonuclease (ribonuclease M5)
MGAVIDFNLAAPFKPDALPQENQRRLESLRSTLKQRAPDLVREIFPAARYQGSEARIGDVSGAPGESMSIQLTGDKAGLWKDHATGEGGDLIDLWAMGQGYQTEGATFWRAVEELEQHFGLSSAPRWTGPVARIAEARAKLPKPPEVTKTHEQTYVYTDSTGQHVLAQVLRYRLSNGKKTFLQKNAAGEWKSPEVRPLYRLPRVAEAATVVLVEGEKCVDALESLGVPATTVMGGAETILDRVDFEPLRGKQVILWPDNDEPGRALMERIRQRLLAMSCDARVLFIDPRKPEKWDAADAIAEGWGKPDLWSFMESALEAQQALVPAPAQTPGFGSSMAFVGVNELEQAEPPSWLMDGMLVERSLACLLAPPAGFKSFIALAWSLCIATGTPWLGKVETKPGRVAYIAGEGQAGLFPRIAAWRQMSGQTDLSRFHVLPRAVDMPTNQLDDLLTAIRALPEMPSLIVLDTLARNYGPGDENSTTDMGAFVRACDRLRVETGATVLIVHHTGKDVERGMRGSSALLGALDTLIALKRKGPCLTVVNKAPLGKQKDAEEFEDIRLVARRVDVSWRGAPYTSLVFEADESVLADEDGAPLGSAAPSPNEAIVLKILRQAAEEGLPALSFSVIQSTTGMNKGSLSTVLKRLVNKGYARVNSEARARTWEVLG